MYGNTCFENNMENDTLEENCDCPIECDSITYSSYYVSTKFNPEEICSKQSGGGLMDQLYDNKFPPHFVRNLRMFAKNEKSKEREICIKYIKYRAEITFQLATNTMSVTVVTRRLSFFDKLSGFGEDKNSNKLLLVY